MNISKIYKEMKAIEARVDKLEEDSKHAHKKPTAKKKKKSITKPEDNLLRRERLEKAPLFSSAELWDHQVKHRKNLLPEHTHKPTTIQQFREWVRKDALLKDKQDAKRIKVERGQQKIENEALEEWKTHLKNNPPKNIKVTLHRVTVADPRRPYAYIEWDAPADSAFTLVGYYIEINGSTWPMRKPNCRKKELLRSYHIGSKVRIGVEYKWGRKHTGISWSCYKYRRK